MTPPVVYGDKPKGGGPESGPLDWMTASATATNDLVIASRESQRAGFLRVAQMSAEAAEFISTAIEPIADPEREATENILNVLRVLLEAVETATNEITEVVPQPQLREFQCRQEFEKCLSNVSPLHQKIACCLAFASCVARDLTTLVIRKD